MSDNHEPYPLIYMGRRPTGADKYGVLLLGVTDATERWFTGKNALKFFKGGVIGGTYDCKRDGDSYIFGKFTHMANYAKPEQLAEWKATDASVDVAARARKLMSENKDVAYERLFNTMRPVRDAYFKTDHIGRLAIEVIVLHALRRP